jgi:hypothetical protein
MSYFTMLEVVRRGVRWWGINFKLKFKALK